MKETVFIHQNQEKWKRFEQLTSEKHPNPEELMELYAEITDDLSYAQTNYQRRTVRAYLNQLAQQTHQLVHRERADSLKKLLTVWSISLPLELYRARKHLLFAACVMLIWVLIGAASTIAEPSFVTKVMGRDYVQMTLENIEKGNPLDVYTRKSQMQMFVDISLNNIRVSFLTFILGIFFTIGTHILVFQNGIMLGAFQGFFYTKGLLLTSFLGIWIHGAFEISSIVISAAAGMTLGNGWLFPGSYTRMQSLQFAARRGLKIMMSLVPFLLFAGFLESFVTRNYDVLNNLAKWLIIGSSFAIIILYFVVYPIVVARKNPHLVHPAEESIRPKSREYVLHQIRDFSQLFTDTFRIYWMKIGAILKLNLFLTIPLMVIIAVVQDIIHSEQLLVHHSFDWQKQLMIITGAIGKTTSDWLAVFGWSVILANFTFSVLLVVLKEEVNFKHGLFLYKQRIIKIWFAQIPMIIAVFLLPAVFSFVMLFLIPFFGLIACSVSSISEDDYSNPIQEGFFYGMKAYSTSLLSITLLLLITFLLAQPIAFAFSGNGGGSVYVEPSYPDLLDLCVKFIKYIFQPITKDYMIIVNVFRQVVYLTFVILLIPLFCINALLIYMDIREKYQSNGLFEQLKGFGKNRNMHEQIGQ